MAAEPRPAPAPARRGRTLAVLLGVAAFVVTADGILVVFGVRIDARHQWATGTP